MTPDNAKTYVSTNIQRRLDVLGWETCDLVRVCTTGDNPVPQNTVYRIARGDNIGMIHHLKRIADELGMTLDELAKAPSSKKLAKVG